MRIWLLLLIFILTSCAGVNEMGCPTVKTVKLNRRPLNYMRAHYRSLSASGDDKETSWSDVRSRPRQVKTIDSIEEWDCPKPGTRTPLPKSVRENIKKNRKKFNAHYKNRMEVDSLGVRASQR